MQVSEVKKLKVGDKVEIKQGSRTYEHFVSEMGLAVGMICTVATGYNSRDNDISVELPQKIGTYSGLYFSPSWIKCKVGSDTKEHHQAEVLRWIADGEEVEQQTTASKEWIELDTSKNFSIFEDHKYRKVEKKFQILCKDNFTHKYFIAKGLFSKEEASNRDDFVQVLE